MRYKFTPVALLILLLCTLSLKSQDRIGIYACGVTIHASGDPNVEYMPLKLTPNSKTIFNYGAIIHYKKHLRTRLSINAIQSFQADCALLFSSATGVVIGYDIVHKGPHRFTFAGGPGFYIRESWYQFKNYQNIYGFKHNNKWEYKIIPIVPIIEYAYLPEGKKIGFTFYGILDPVDNVYNFGAGINYQIGNK